MVRHGLATVLAASLLLGIVACNRRSPAPSDPAAEPEPPSLFADVTAASGIDFTYHNGQEAGHYAILESLGGGLALLDYDGDGLLDIFVTGGGRFTGKDNKDIQGLPCKLYKNLGNWK